MKAQSMRALALCSLAALGACAEEGAGRTGPGVTIEVAPLSLPATTGTEYALAVFNAPPTNPMFLPAGTVVTAGNIAALVWNQSSVTSNQFGNGAGGDISYVGPCDASLGGPSTNYIALALKQVAAGANGGSFTGSGPTTPAINNTVFATGTNNILDDQNTAIGGSNVLSADSDPDFENPCPYDDPCVLDFPCKENQDVAVVFNLTIMRDANQGFFDIAVNFEDIFCSAKFDTCYEQGDLPVELLFGDDTDTVLGGPDTLGDEPGRDWTGVYAMACTAGAQSGVITDILMSAVAVTCPGPVTFNLPISGLAQPAGNQTVTAPFGVVQYATYYGQEGLLCPIPGFPNNPCNKAYFNIAINLEDLPAGCTLSLQATVQDSANPAFTGGFPTTFDDDSGTTYPYVNVVAAPLSQACTQNPLNGGDGHVSTFYGSTMNSGTLPSVMTDHSENGADPAVIPPPVVADTTRPTVNVVTPADGTTGFGIGTDITVTFSEAMLASTIDANSIRLAKGGAILSNVSAVADAIGTYFVTSTPTWFDKGYLANNLVLVAASTDGTLPSGFYRVRLLQDFKLYLADLSGNAVNFSAAARADLTPFNWVAGVVTASGASATFNPDSDLINDTNYMDIVVNAATDAAGNALLNNYLWYFTTVASPPLRIFVTSQGFEAQFGGLSGADALCGSAAAALGGQWKAWLSYGQDSPSNRFTAATRGARAFTLVDGTLLANNWADLTDGTLSHAIDMSQDGVVHWPSARVWTNTQGDGTSADPMANACNGFTSSSQGTPPPIGYTGVVEGWSWYTNWPIDVCYATLPLFCVEQGPATAN